ncbi:MAG TPA: acetyl-CoA decarbonylase/synthase complex subunit gamma [Methanomassiliicoccales archaeon]|jgi:acetyl-CoA decarbonylase/synthase complex subunit gamma
MPTAIEIFKHLPKKNCGECKHPTCLAFAMQLANQKAKLEDCPYVSDAGKQALAASSAPPIRLVKVGTGKATLEMGDETELYRHDKKFFHPVRYSIIVPDTLAENDVVSRVQKANAMRFERVGQIMALDMVCVRNDSKDTARFVATVEKVSSSTELPIILASEDPAAIKAACLRISAKVPLISAATKANLTEMAAVAKEFKCPLVVRESNLNDLADMVAKVKLAGIEDIVLDFAPGTLKELIEKSTVIRKLSVKKTFRGLGYPLLVNAPAGNRGVTMGLISTMKYGSIVVFEELLPQMAIPLFVLRQNIYTDPQVPIQVKPGLYPIGNPTEDSPILFTTNFSLTYFTVLGDIDKSKVPVWLQVVDCEGLSVLTAFAAGKLTSEGVVHDMDRSGARTKSKKNVLIIPGMVARMSPKLAELTGMKIVVGPKESSGLPKMLKSLE